MNENQSVAEQLIALKKKNLRFFATHQPDLYRQVANTAMTRVELLVSPQEPDLDLKVDGESWYGGKARERSLQEVDTFLKTYKRGSRIKSLHPAFAEQFLQGLVSERFMYRAAKASPVTREGFEGYRIEREFPYVAFLGVGLGIHIEALVSRADIVGATVVEPDVEVFSASLFTCDWEKVAESFRKAGRRLRFVVGFDHRGENLKKVLQRELYRSMPVYPLVSINFNHRGNTAFDRAIKEMGAEFPGVMASYVGYEDAIRRFNNTLHNFRQGGGVLDPETRLPFQAPVLIVGSGPSIDSRMDSIVRVRDRVIIVSSGTGLRGLLKHGIKPDFHVELDPRYEMYEVVRQAATTSDIRGICFLGAQDVNPLLPELFEKRLLYIKSDSMITRALGQGHLGFPHCNPTCTNAALSLFMNMGFREVFLFGTDYGFRSVEQSHSRSSIYQATDVGEDSLGVKEKANKTFVQGHRIMKVRAVDGEEIDTWPDFYNAIKAVENLILEQTADDSGKRVINCSDGALIRGAEWFDDKRFVEHLAPNKPMTPEDRQCLHRALADQSGALSGLDLDGLVNSVSSELRNRAELITRILRRFPLSDRRAAARVALELAHNIDRIVVLPGASVPSGPQLLAQYFFRGAVLSLTGLGVAHAMAMPDREVPAFLKQWRQQFMECLNMIPAHFEDHFTSLKSVDADPWVHKYSDDPDRFGAP